MPPTPLQSSDILSWFGLSARGDSCKLQMSLLKHLGLRQGEDIKTVKTHLHIMERHSQVWTSGGEKPSLTLSLLPCSPHLHTPNALGFSLPIVAPDSPSQCAPRSYLCRVFS